MDGHHASAHNTIELEQPLKKNTELVSFTYIGDKTEPCLIPNTMLKYSHFRQLHGFYVNSKETRTHNKLFNEVFFTTKLN